MEYVFGDHVASVLKIVLEHLDDSALQLCEVLNRVVQMVPGEVFLTLTATSSISHLPPHTASPQLLHPPPPPTIPYHSCCIHLSSTLLHLGNMHLACTSDNILHYLPTTPEKIAMDTLVEDIECTNIALMGNAIWSQKVCSTTHRPPH
tara:strand:+ start:241 stop:684 length:444 start_codon:yes stop_codon:yes gene_type:complete